MSEDEIETVHAGPDSDSSDPGSARTLRLGLSGRRIAHYWLIKELGQGGQGYVYLARDENLNRNVALKILMQRSDMSYQARIRFEREAEAASKLDHPGIARVYEVGEDEGLAYIAFELVQGRTLMDHISEAASETTAGDSASEVKLPRDAENESGSGSGAHDLQSKSATGQGSIVTIVRYIESAARAIHAAHEAGLVHRDIKPSNLMVRDDGSACVLDFGLAKDEDSLDVTLTQTGDLVGTPAYMSPEQIQAERTGIDRRTDVYSLGVTLFEACTLQRPFAGTNRQELYHAISHKEPDSPKALNARVPKDLAAIILTAIDKDRDRRYPTALALAQDLQRFREFEPVQASPAGPWIKARRWTQRNPAVALGITGIVLMSVVAAGIFYFKSEEANEARDLAQEESRKKSIALAAEQAAVADFERLADVKRLRQARTRADALWPAEPDKAGAMRDWLKNYDRLLLALPDHRRALTGLRRSALPYAEEERRRDHAEALARINLLDDALTEAESELSLHSDSPRGASLEAFISKTKQEREELVAQTRLRGSWNFGSDGVKQWKHDVLAELVQELSKFAEPEDGTYADVKRRLAEAQTIATRSIDDHKELWTETIAEIGKSEKYNGLTLVPQLGLVPLGKDPASGLFEFLHLQTHRGPLPVRDARGSIPLTPDTGLILVLIPAGKFKMGSQKTDPTGSNYDPWSKEDEKIREVTIEEAYFLSKYEMTQGQWQRAPAEIKQPSFYYPGWNYEGHKGDVGLLNPVEQVSWTMCAQTLSRLGLGLPSEEQWEYAARAGTDTTFVGGISAVSDISAWGNIAGTETRTIFPAFEQSCFDGYIAHAPVGQFRANQFGLHDVLGNVFEWTSTPSGTENRFLRGGSFGYTAEDVRVAFRNELPKDQRNNIIGLRPARLLKQAP